MIQGPADNSNLTITASDLRVKLSGNDVLHDLSFEIEEGDWVGLIGPNGSGKTTLLRAIGGLIAYDGSLKIGHTEVSTWNSKSLARALAFVRQHSNLQFDFTVRDIVELGLSPHLNWLEAPSNDLRDRVVHALQSMDLVALTGRSVSTLSGGEQQRVQLAQAVVQDSQILLLDEPTAHLDIHHQHDLMHRITEQRMPNTTIVGAFHDLEFAARYATKLLVLNHGRVVTIGTPADVLTEQLISSVFNMEADIDQTIDGRLRIHYLQPTSSVL